MTSFFSWEHLWRHHFLRQVWHPRDCPEHTLEHVTTTTKPDAVNTVVIRMVHLTYSTVDYLKLHFHRNRHHHHHHWSADSTIYHHDTNQVLLSNRQQYYELALFGLFGVVRLGIGDRLCEICALNTCLDKISSMTSPCGLPSTITINPNGRQQPIPSNNRCLNLVNCCLVAFHLVSHPNWLWNWLISQHGWKFDVRKSPTLQPTRYKVTKRYR